jgi:hypothetical protein
MEIDKKGEFLKDWIERKMSKHDWFKGVKYVDIKQYKLRDKEIPWYIFYLDTDGYKVSTEFEDDFDSIFQMFFPTDDDYDTNGVWEFRYV